MVLVAWHEADDEQVARALRAGADDFIPYGRPLELLARVAVRLRNKRYRDALRRVRTQRDVLLRQATVDPLTGIVNRRALEDALNSFFTSSARFGFLFLDIDHFKRVNDRFGHDAGDQVLRGIADYLKKAVRAGDVCGRFGGEESVLLVHGADVQIAERIEERHRLAIGRIRHPKIGPTTPVTVSIGVGAFDPARPDLDTQALLRRADSVLYEAKRLGRNRVVVASPARNPAEGPSSGPPSAAVLSMTVDTPERNPLATARDRLGRAVSRPVRIVFRHTDDSVSWIHRGQQAAHNGRPIALMPPRTTCSGSRIWRGTSTG